MHARYTEIKANDYCILATVSLPILSIITLPVLHVTHVLKRPPVSIVDSNKWVNFIILNKINIVLSLKKLTCKPHEHKLNTFLRRLFQYCPYLRLM